MSEPRNWINGALPSPDGEFPLCLSLLISIHSVDGHFSRAMGERGEVGGGVCRIKC